MNKPMREGFVDDEQEARESARIFPGPKVIEATKAETRAEPKSPEPPLEPESLVEDVDVSEQALGEKWPITVRLMNKNIKNNRGEEISELVFREPTGGDINRIGNPIRVDLAGDVHIDDRRMLLMMTALTGIMTPMLERMDPRDYSSCAYRLRLFFLPNPAAW